MTAKRTLLIVIMSVISLFPFLSKAQNLSLFDKGVFINKTDTLPYRILLPLNFDPAKKYPVVFILHGSGERGNDNQAQLKYGPKLFLNDTIRKKYPAIIIFPQCPKEPDYWSNVIRKPDSNGKEVFHFQAGGEPTHSMRSLIGLLDQFLKEPFVDKHRVYIGGLSMGGMGTFEILRRRPEVFAAAFPICGGDNTLNAKIYAKKTPVWVFHGAKDNVIAADHSIIMVNAIKAAGGNAKLTIYPNDGHNSWDDAFAEPDLLPWLFGNRK